MMPDVGQFRMSGALTKVGQNLPNPTHMMPDVGQFRNVGALTQITELLK